MEQFLADIRTYSEQRGVSPQKLLREAIGASWRQWDAWTSGQSSPTMIVADRVRAHMAANPPRSAEDAA